MKRIPILLVSLVAISCTDRETTDVQLNSAVALASAREAISTAWTAASRESTKITANSSKAALEEAQRQTARLQSELGKIEVKSPLNEAQTKAMQDQMAKIQAAMNVQDLKTQSEQAVANAIASGKIAQQKYEDASRELARLDASYRDLTVRLDAAQNLYDQASSSLANALEQVRQLGSGN